jgi:hypothetical protein
MATKPTFELQINMKGTDKKALRDKLMEIVMEFDSQYGKPCQGTISSYRVETKVVTPIWGGQDY